LCPPMGCGQVAVQHRLHDLPWSRGNARNRSAAQEAPCTMWRKRQPPDRHTSRASSGAPTVQTIGDDLVSSLQRAIGNTALQRLMQSKDRRSSVNATEVRLEQRANQVSVELASRRSLQPERNGAQTLDAGSRLPDTVRSGVEDVLNTRLPTCACTMTMRLTELPRRYRPGPSRARIVSI
jgi:hypothetical protein